MPMRCRFRRGQCMGGVQPRRIRRFIEPALLLLLHSRPMHGYALLEGLDRLGFDTYPADPSTVYRILRDLEEAGMIESEWDADETAGPPRRVYRLAAAGDAYLRDWVAELRATDHLLHRFLEAYEDHMEQDGIKPQAELQKKLGAEGNTL
jgi:PadR family transcriptional regulator PadR